MGPFLGHRVFLVNGGRVTRVRLQGRYTRKRSAISRVRVVVPRDHLVQSDRREGYRDLSRLKAVHSAYLVDSSVLWIFPAYNAELCGLADYYRLVYCAKFSLRKLHFLWHTLTGFRRRVRRSIDYRIPCGPRAAPMSLIFCAPGSAITAARPARHAQCVTPTDSRTGTPAQRLVRPGSGADKSRPSMSRFTSGRFRDTVPWMALLRVDTALNAPL